MSAAVALFDALDDPLLNLPGEFPDLPASKRGNCHPVTHLAVLETELFLELIQGDRPFLCGLLEGLLGVFYVLAVLQRLQQFDVLEWSLNRVYPLTPILIFQTGQSNGLLALNHSLRGLSLFPRGAWLRRSAREGIAQAS